MSGGDPQNAGVTDVVIHTGTNNLTTSHKRILINRIGEALHTARKIFPNATVHYSPIIPKKKDDNIKDCDEINETIRKLCGFGDNNFCFIDTRGLFVRDGRIRWDRLSHHDRLHLNRKGIVAMGKHLKYTIYRGVGRELPAGEEPPTYSP